MTEGVTYRLIKGLLSTRDMRRLYDEFDESTLETSGVTRGGQTSPNRIGTLAWLRRPAWRWLYDIVRGAAARENAAAWQFQLGESVDELQFARYQKGDRYGWHADNYAGSSEPIASRELSVVVLLREAEKGGGLELRNGGVIALSPGDGVVFPSTEEHRAIEVQEGTRDSLVLWINRAAIPDTAAATFPPDSDDSEPSEQVPWIRQQGLSPAGYNERGEPLWVNAKIALAQLGFKDPPDRIGISPSYQITEKAWRAVHNGTWPWVYPGREIPSWQKLVGAERLASLIGAQNHALEIVVAEGQRRIDATCKNEIGLVLPGQHTPEQIEECARLHKRAMQLRRRILSANRESDITLLRIRSDATWKAP